MAGLSFFDISVKFEFSHKERLRFYEKMRQLMINGVNLDMALQQVQKIAARKKGSILPVLYNRWRHNISNGMNFGQCLAPYVPSAEAVLLETGANSGRLVTAIENAIESIEQQGKVKKAIIGAAAYPAVLFAMLIAAMLMSAHKVIPTFEEIIPTEEWQGIAYGVAVASQFIRDHGGLIGIVFAGLVFLIFYSMPRWTGPMRVSFDKFVPWSLYRILQGSAFLLSVSSMMGAGVKIDEVSLGKISRQSDPYLRERINGIKRYITSGENLGDALYHCGYQFPDEDIIADLQIYANLRGFDQNLIKITQTWVDGLVERVTISMKIVNTVILMLIAVVIGCLILSFYSVFQQIQSVQQSAV